MTRTIADLPSVNFSGEDIMSGHFPELLAAAAIQHGPIFKWIITEGWDIGEYVYMVGPEANRFVFHTGREHFSHNLGWTPIIGEIFGKGLLNMDDPEHARHRKMWNPAFTAAAMERYIPVMQRVITERSSHWTQQSKINIYAEAREITFDIAAAALGGIERGVDVDQMRKLFYIILTGADPEQENPANIDFTQVLMQLRGTLLNLIAQRRAHPDDGPPTDVVGMIVRAKDDDGQSLSDEQVLAHINILLVAGHETTTTLAAWALYTLAIMPEQRARLLEELNSLVGSEPASVEALRSMRVMDAFIREVGRLYPPVINVPRGVVSDFEFAGYRIPAGTMLRLSLGGAHRLPHVFEQPERFDLDRFLAPRDEERRTPYSLVTFGGGARICIGINFAQIEVKALLAHVLRNYQLEAASPPGRHAGHWTATIPEGLWLKIKA